ncbi:MAG: ATP-binding protein [Nitrospira sp.]
MKVFRKIFLNDYLWLVVVATMIIIVGFFITEDVVKNEDTELKGDMFRLAQTFAGSIDADRYQTIQSSPSDNDNPDYKIVRKQLIELGNINKDVGVKWIYTLVPRDGQIVFSVDSIEDSNHSEPGDIYTEASPDFRKAVDQAWVYGKDSLGDIEPYTDRWGTFISILTPIRDKETDIVIGVLAIDLDYYHFYKNKINNIKALLYSITLAVASIFILVRSHRIISKRKDRKLIDSISEERNKAEHMVKERTKELNEEKTKLISSINSISFGYILTDIDGNIVLSNPSLFKILQIDSSPKSLSDFSKLFEKNNLLAYFKSCFDSKHSDIANDIEYKNKLLKIFCSPVIDGDHAIGYVFLIEDVTEVRMMERSKDEFFSIASHELRTPLTAIRGNSQMLREDYRDQLTNKDMAEMIDDIYDSSVRLIDIVNDFLSVSRLEQGRVEIKKEKFNVSDIINKSMNLVETMSKSKGLDLSYSLVEGVNHMVFSDKSKVEQVMLNLLGNAIKFTNKGSIKIKTEDIGGFIKIMVTDTGVGISEKNEPLLFRKFQQANENILARDVTQGTGLGLYICHLIISKLGGTIGLEKSVVGEGSTFSFTLPLVDDKII